MSQLKIVSWNIWGGVNLNEVISCLRESNADIIGLQEVLQDEDGTNNVAQAIAEELGYKWVFGSTTTLTPEVSHLLKEHNIQSNKKWGNAILSKFEILGSNLHALSETNKRTAIEITIKVDEKDVHIFSTHLVHHKHPIEVRLEQVSNLLELVPERYSVIMGDFNATPNNEVILKVSSNLNNSEKDLTKPTTLTEPPEKIDYIFVSKDIKVISSGLLDSKASDHLPIFTVIEI